MQQLDTAQHEMDPVVFAQVKLLSCIGMLYSGEQRLGKYAWRQHGDLTSFCRNDWAWEPTVANAVEGGIEPVDQDWIKWKDVEQRRRTGYAVWVSIHLEVSISL